LADSALQPPWRAAVGGRHPRGRGPMHLLKSKVRGADVKSSSGGWRGPLQRRHRQSASCSDAQHRGLATLDAVPCARAVRIATHDPKAQAHICKNFWSDVPSVAQVTRARAGDCRLRRARLTSRPSGPARVAARSSSVHADSPTVALMMSFYLYTLKHCPDPWPRSPRAQVDDANDSSSLFRPGRSARMLIWLI
jgi:hypothetical protein